MVLPSHEELLREHLAGKTYTELGAKYGVSPNVIKGKVRTASVKERMGQKTTPRPDLFDIKIGTPLKLSGDFISVGDVHVPTTNYKFAALPAAVGRKQLKHPRLIVTGDLYNMDVFSKYPALLRQPTMEEEWEAARHLLTEWLEVFEHIYILPGNHDRRATKMTKDVTLSKTLLRAAAPDETRVTVSDFSYCVVETEKGPWRITHPEEYSKTQLKVGDELALKYQMNIISFHEHHLAMGFDRYKRYIIVNGGGLFDEEVMSYARADDNAKANMQRGFVMLKSGFPYIFGDERLTDYSRWI